MEEKSINNEESAAKRSRSNEEIKDDKDISSSSDSGKQSPHEHQETQQNASSANQNDGGSTGIGSQMITNSSDSGLSFKMEDSSCGNTDMTEVGEETIDALLDSKKKEEKEDQEMFLNENVSESEERVSDTDKPTTSVDVAKRHKRNRSRNYRAPGRSSSSSSNASGENNAENRPIQQEENESLENITAADDTDPTVFNSSAEVPSSPSPNLFLPNFLESSSVSSSTDSSSDSNGDDTDFEPSLLGDRLNMDFASNESGDSTRAQEKDEDINELVNKQKPAYKWCGSYELMRREHGLSGDGKTSLPNGFSCGFNKRFYASRHVIERMKISHVLRKHSGCVNCVNFNKAGDLLVSGSDDFRLIVWDWANNKTKNVWRSGHTANIFQSKFLPSSSCIDIISAGRDGKVRRSIVPPSGGKVQVSQLYSHLGAVHKLTICPDNPSEIISVGEDGCIFSKDLRESTPKNEMLKVLLNKKKHRKVLLFSISHHPFAPEICVSGSDRYVRVYDKRAMSVPVHTMSPKNLVSTRTPNVTCCVYNNTGSEILATYSEDNIYLFDNKNYVPEEYLHVYKGHFNQKTIKGVNFFGPNCEYVISGSDCGNIFYWDKNTEAILNFMPGDTAGVVNCLEPHPNTPILATSGLDHNIKIWTPSAEKHPPDLSKLLNCVKSNIRRTSFDHLRGIDDGRMHFFIRQILCRRGNFRHRNREENASDSDDNSSSDDSSVPDMHSGNDDSDDDSNFHTLSCGTQ